MPRRPDPAVVTGMGAVTPYGVGVAALDDGLLSGRPTARTITRFDASAHPVRFACEVPAFDAVAHLPRRLARQVDPFAAYALVAAHEALSAAGLLAGTDDGVRIPVVGADPERVAVCVASGLGAVDEATSQHARLLAGGPRSVRPYLSIAMPLNMAGGQIAIRHGLRGPSFAVVSACASAADALGAGLDLLRAGRADVVLAGGAEAPVNPLTMAGFATAGALSTRNDAPQRASRPFDVDRDGFVCGEGAGLLVLERADHARARGATVLAELSGYGATTDAHHVTQPPPGGAGAARAMRLALRDADAGVDEVDHVNAHGTGTVLNDAAEATALRAVLGSAADRVAVTATKSAIGHLLGAAGAVEAVATVRALCDGVVAPTQNLERLDPACDLDVVTAAPRKALLRAALCNSFGFGGHNAALMFRAVDGRSGPPLG